MSSTARSRSSSADCSAIPVLLAIAPVPEVDIEPGPLECGERELGVLLRARPADPDRADEQARGAEREAAAGEHQAGVGPAELLLIAAGDRLDEDVRGGVERAGDERL